MALILRWDVSRNFRGGNYFVSAYGGYCLGLATTIGVMNYFKVRARPVHVFFVETSCCMHAQHPRADRMAA